MTTTARRVTRESSIIIIRFVVVATLATLLMEAVLGLYDRTGTWLLQNTPRESVFNYESVSYLGQTPSGHLQMQSVSVWNRDIDVVVFNDQLLCGNPSGIMSTQTETRHLREAEGLAPHRWTYSGARPADGSTTECRMRSVVTAEIDGVAWSQVVESPRFRPGIEQGESSD